jgi:hypothetical protein
MDKERMAKRIAEWRPIAVRGIGRLRLRWEDDVSRSRKTEDTELE